MSRYSRAAVMLLAEGHFWSEPKDKEHWNEAVDVRGYSARQFIDFVRGRGFPG